MVGQLRLKTPIEEWEGDDEVTFYSANVNRPRPLGDLAGSSASSSSASSSSSTSDLSANVETLQDSNHANEVLDALRSQSGPEDVGSTGGGEVKLNIVCRYLGKFHAHVAVSVILLVSVSSISVLLGALAIKVVKPEPQWDKSLDAFEIPNHPSTIRREMFELAQKDRGSPQRPRRSVEEFVASSAMAHQFDHGNTKHQRTTPIEAIKAKLSGRPKAHASDYSEDDVFHPLPVDHLMPLGDNSLGGGDQVASRTSDPQDSPRVLSNNTTDDDAPSNAERNSAGTSLNKAEAGLRLNHVHRRSTRRGHRRSQSWRIQLVYMARGLDENIFTAERLNTIQQVERSIMEHPDFTKFCAKNEHSWTDPALSQFDHCLPPNSLMTYFFPSQVDDVIRYDGMGSELADINGTLTMAMNQPTFYWFVDTNMTSTNRRSKFIRSEIWFGSPVGDGSMGRHEEYQAYKEFVFTYIKLLDKASTDKVDVLYGGTEIFDHEVSETIYHDVFLSIPTFLAIFILLLVFTSFSVWLTLWGLLSIICSFACAYFSYRVFFGVEALGLLNVVSVFVIIGIGVDDVFVFVNTFRQAEAIKDPAVRMGYTISTAGAATFFTSVTTAGAFGANMASQIPAIFDFGLFMMLLVVFCWVMVAALMPPALNLWHRYLNCELRLMQKCKARSSASPNRRSTSLYRVLAQYESQGGPAQLEAAPSPPMTVVPTDHLLDDSDIPMLDLEDEQEEQGLLTDDEDDVPLLQVSSTPPDAASAENREAASLTSGLQRLLHGYVAIPVMKARWAIIVLFCIILGVTIALVSQLQPASRPPALYRPDTNLQRLLDLAYNFSGKDISCRDCSGFEHGGTHPAPPIVPLVPVDPGVLTPRPELPTHSPETTFWPPVGSTTHPAKGGKGTGGGGDTVSSPTASSSPQTNGTTHHKIAPTPPAKKETCTTTGLRCKFGAVCQDTDAGERPHCVCQLVCDQDDYSPVCGSDSRTYGNVCQMKQYACLDKREIYVTKAGLCEDPPKVKPTPGKAGHHGGDDPSSGQSIDPSSPGKGYDPCATSGHCGKAASRPLLDSTAMVFVVFGISGVDKTNVSTGHVLNEDKGAVLYDPEFSPMQWETVKALCKICKTIGNNGDLVKDGGAECFPPAYLPTCQRAGMMLPEECSDLPATKRLVGQRSHAKMGLSSQGAVWFAMAFESKIYEGKSSFEAYKDYLAWEKAITEMKEGLTEEERVGLDSAFQTCDYWEQVFMEIIGVTSAIYGVAFSLIVCVVAVAFFTAHLTILLIAFVTIAGVILVVVSLFYLLGWQMGAVEAVSLSILVGSSIDYCIHLVEGYRVAANHVKLDSGKSSSHIRRQRAIHSMSTIGVSILSSALTTVIAAIPLCFTTVQLFAKFGQIVALNTLVSIAYTLTACAAFLGCFAPARYRWSWRWLAVTVLVVGAIFGVGVGALYGLHLKGVAIPGPSGNTLFG
ncbi:protein dispatched homolog 3-like [Diadema antillarum]|uniref:protein dispatched homolog 3-like n=1 Tax=Diadema antillarum TaxID=105358 RepID=UPI003A888817